MNHCSSNLDSHSNVHQLIGREVHFGFGIKPEVDIHLQKAASLVASREKSLQALKQAERAAPDQLEVLVALFKFHFYQGETEAAETLVLKTLEAASQQGGFCRDWRRLTAQSTDWHDPRAPGRLYLYSLKALAFIRLRQNAQDAAESILNTLARLDPQNQVGADVIRDLLDAIAEEQNDG